MHNPCMWRVFFCLKATPRGEVQAFTSGGSPYLRRKTTPPDDIIELMLRGCEGDGTRMGKPIGAGGEGGSEQQLGASIISMRSPIGALRFVWHTSLPNDRGPGTYLPSRHILGQLDVSRIGSKHTSNIERTNRECF